MLGGFLTLFVSLSMRGQLSRVPGLALYPDFLSEAEGVIAATAARRLSRSAAAAAKGMVGSTSRNHNVNQREEYVRVTLQDDDDAASSLPPSTGSRRGRNLVLPRSPAAVRARPALAARGLPGCAGPAREARAARDVAGSPLKWRCARRYAVRRGGGAAPRAGFPVACRPARERRGLVHPRPRRPGRRARGRGGRGAVAADDGEPRTADHGAGVGEMRAPAARAPRGCLSWRGRRASTGCARGRPRRRAASPFMAGAMPAAAVWTARGRRLRPVLALRRAAASRLGPEESPRNSRRLFEPN